jgi:hypothetical protein
LYGSCAERKVIYSQTWISKFTKISMGITIRTLLIWPTSIHRTYPFGCSLKKSTREFPLYNDPGSLKLNRTTQLLNLLALLNNDLFFNCKQNSEAQDHQWKQWKAK